MKILIYLFFGFGLFCSNANTELNWMSIHDIESKVKEEPKKVLIKVYADWCKPCQNLANSFQDERVMDLLSDKFHLVNFEMESDQKVEFKGKTYGLTDNLSIDVNELAYEFMDRKLSFPVLLVLDDRLNVIKKFKGSCDPEQLIERINSI